MEEDLAEKLEREESERLAKIEAERLRNEMNERLKKEEKEREERRKRVEAIMARTRVKNGQENSPSAAKVGKNGESTKEGEEEDEEEVEAAKTNELNNHVVVVDAVNNITNEEKNQNIEKMDSNVIEYTEKGMMAQENIENIFETMIISEVVVANNKLNTNGLKIETEKPTSLEAVENNKNIDFGVTSVDNFM